MSAVARARMDESLKEEAEQILKSLGLSSSEAIRLFYQQIVNRGTLPIELKVPNAVTQAAIDESRNEANSLDTYDSFEELLDDLE